MRYLLILATAIVLIQCKTSKANATSDMPTDKELAVAQKTWPSATLEELKEGHSIYKNQCRECHKNYTITKFSERKWKHEIDDMSPKAKLSEAQKEKLSKFILSYREANTPVAQAK